MLNASFVRLGLTRTLIATMSSLLFFCLNANAQSVVVKPKDGAEGWEISYSRMFDPNNYELDTVCSTMAAAQQEVARLKVWNGKIDPKDSWRLHTILIVGAEANSASAGNGGIGPKISNFIDAAKLVADAKKIAGDPVKALVDAAKPDTGLKEYAKTAGMAYENAKKAKEELLKLTGKTVKDGFVRVNLLVDQYNKTADDLTKSSGFGAVPKMSKVSEKTLKAADDWRAARDKQFDLEGQKQRLDDDRQKLEVERQALYQAYQQSGDPIPADLVARIKRYREQQDVYNSSVAAFEAETKMHETNVASIDKNLSAEEKHWLVGTTWSFTEEATFGNKVAVYGKGTFYHNRGLITFVDHNTCCVLWYTNNKLKRENVKWSLNAGTARIEMKASFLLSEDITFDVRNDTNKMVSLNTIVQKATEEFNDKYKYILKRGEAMITHRNNTGIWNIQFVEPGISAEFTKATE